VALGTSLPDTFASKSAAVGDKNADNAIGNVTGSNSVNVFLGLGLPWVIATIYHAVRVSKPEHHRIAETFILKNFLFLENSGWICCSGWIIGLQCGCIHWLCLPCYWIVDDETIPWLFWQGRAWGTRWAKMGFKYFPRQSLVSLRNPFLLTIVRPHWGRRLNFFFKSHYHFMAGF
jgi:hypothetical protein